MSEGWYTFIQTAWQYKKMNSKFFNILVVHIDCDQLQVSVYYSRKFWLNMSRLFLQLQFTAVWDTWWRTSPSFVKNFVSYINILNLNRIVSERYDVEGFRAPLEQTGKEVTCDLEGSRGHRLLAANIWSGGRSFSPTSDQWGQDGCWALSGCGQEGHVSCETVQASAWDQVWQEVFLRCRLWTGRGRLSTSGSSSSSQVAIWRQEWLMRIRSRSADQRLQLQVEEAASSLVWFLSCCWTLWPEEAFWVSASHPVVQHRTLHRRPLHLVRSADLAKVHDFRYHSLTSTNQSPPSWWIRVFLSQNMLSWSLQRCSLLFVQWNKLQV